MLNKVIKWSIRNISTNVQPNTMGVEQFYDKERLGSKVVAFRKLNRPRTCFVSKARPILLRWQVYKRRQRFMQEK